MRAVVPNVPARVRLRRWGNPRLRLAEGLSDAWAVYFGPVTDASEFGPSGLGSLRR